MQNRHITQFAFHSPYLCTVTRTVRTLHKANPTVSMSVFDMRTLCEHSCFPSAYNSTSL